MRSRATLTQLEEPPDPAACRVSLGGSTNFTPRSPGTSMAAPQVAAVGAMMRALNPYASLTDLLEIDQANRPASGRLGLGRHRQRLGDPQRRRRARRDAPSGSPGARLPDQRPAQSLRAPPDCAAAVVRPRPAARWADCLRSRLLPRVREHRQGHSARSWRGAPLTTTAGRSSRCAPATATSSTRWPSTTPATTETKPVRVRTRFPG